MKDDRLNLYLIISEIAGIFTAAIGLFVLAGWMFNIPLMKSVLPNLVTMKANTAACFTLAGIALWSLQIKRIDKQSFRILAKLCASAVALIGALTLYEYLYGKNLGIDQLIFKEQAGAVFTTYAGRMALNTSINFIIIGIALLMLDVKIRGEHFPAQLLALVEGGMALLVLLGYIYGISTFYDGFGVYTAMALHTTLAFIVAGLGILFARPGSGLTGILTSDTMGGIMLRRLIPILIVLPPALGWLKLKGERLGLFNNEFGTTLAVMGGVVMAFILILLVTGMINRIDAKRKMAQDILAVSDKEWLRTFNSISDAIFIMDKNNNIINVNDALLSILKKRPYEIIGKKCYEVMHNIHNPWPGCPLEKTKNDHKSHDEEVNDSVIGVPLLVTTSPIFDDNGNFVGAVHIAKDISERKKTEEDMRVILDSAPAWIFYKDRENRFVRVNKAFADVMQMSKEELAYKSLFDLYPREQAEAYWRDDKEIVNSGKAKTNIIEFVDTKKGRFWVHTDKIPHRNKNGEVIGVIGFSMDITERKLAEEAITKKVRDLEIFYKASIDRETKIKELKKKIQELETRLEDEHHT